eukprot:SAG31_NODE_2995_length_4804_cov_9.959192_3_plen_163_part_00
MELLIKRGAEIDLTAEGGWTALMVAALEGRLLAARALANASCDLGMQETAHGLTAAAIALQQGHHAVYDMIRQQTTGWIKLRVHSATDLRAADHYYSDPYCIIEVGDTEQSSVSRYATHVVNRTLNPVWDCVFDVPVTHTTSTIKVIAMDTDDFGESKMPAH